TIPKSETKIAFSAALPWNFSTRQINHSLRLSGVFGLTQEHFNEDQPSLPSNINITPRMFQTGRLRANWSLYRILAYRDIFPRWGLSTEIDLNAGFSPSQSQLLYISQSLYWPGFSKNDGFKIKW